MKELSVEEKAKRYDEAKINGSRLWECGEITRTNYEYIFPEPTESEDEKIRKALVEHIKGIYKGSCTEEMCKERDMFLAWLEKHKYTEDDLDKAYKCADEVQYRRGYEDAKKEIEKPQSSSPISYGIKLEKRMNEACNRFFAPNTDVNRYSASDLFYAGVKAERDLNMPVWNEDDEKLFSRISGIIHNAAYQNYDLDVNGEEVGEYANIMRWFKSLKERVQPQVKQEWKPTDEQINTLFKYSEQNNKDGSILTSLYNELKKLRGE